MYTKIKDLFNKHPKKTIAVCSAFTALCILKTYFGPHFQPYNPQEVGFEKRSRITLEETLPADVSELGLAFTPQEPLSPIKEPQISPISSDTHFPEVSPLQASIMHEVDSLVETLALYDREANTAVPRDLRELYRTYSFDLIGLTVEIGYHHQGEENEILSLLVTDYKGPVFSFQDQDLDGLFFDSNQDIMVDVFTASLPACSVIVHSPDQISRGELEAINRQYLNFLQVVNAYLNRR